MEILGSRLSRRLLSFAFRDLLDLTAVRNFGQHTNRMPHDRFADYDLSPLCPAHVTLHTYLPSFRGIQGCIGVCMGILGIQGYKAVYRGILGYR